MDGVGWFRYTKNRGKGAADVKWRIILDPGSNEVTVTISAPTRTEEVEALAALLAREEDLPGWRGEEMTPLAPREILCFYTADKGVFAWTAAGEYRVRLRLYELEERLDRRRFVRISHSEIVNLKKVTALDLSLGGTIRLTLEGGRVCWVSRRYVKKIKEALGL